ncbi:ATP synthase gamma chain [Minicystis rosea]|nr:ATP synthase gamma chain [Minicystis rosea]
MPSLKAIRKRITSVQSTQKITRAMKMVAGAKLNRAQTRITELRPYAVKTQEVLSAITARAADAAAAESESVAEAPAHPLLEDRPEKRVLMLVVTSDRGLCGAFNTNINKRAEREWRERTDAGQEVQLVLVGRKGRDYMNRRGAPVLEYLPGVWDKLNLETAQRVGAAILAPFNRKEVDAIYLVYNEFKSAMSQQVVVERLLPVARPSGETKAEGTAEFIFEPTKGALLERLVPMYVDVSILRALYESQASFFGAQMTAMDSATKNAKEMIGSLTLQYNKARQAAITKELMEIIGGSEALKD